MAGQRAAGSRQGRLWLALAAVSVMVALGAPHVAAQSGPSLTPAQFGFGTVVVGNRSPTRTFTFSS